ncbi:DNA-processing protein DprA [Paenibacillus jilunlii]|uniref:DNA processing protein n=1 Tax=Paenibacillus jilunlii TaxID=682956 RepID=A0A1G9NB31_9BACL|nr:DNA-processing protein DprA [Paenibacillus jilunlii]KWX75574.1 DNA-binding protein [Paenibacillus jilunlii]SDL83095.1 DNA processing protein [Paenibacillus jilunlii]
MEPRELLIGFNEVEGIGWKTIDRICREGLLTENAFFCSSEDWGRLGINAKTAHWLAADFNQEWIYTRSNLMKESGVAAVTLLDEDYPELLKESPEPPWVLYYRGRVELASCPAIAMVGTRVPTAYGRKVGEMLAMELSMAGLTVVSGLARGIDSICHETALRKAGSTIAVVATGLDRVYPPENRELEQEISRQGLVISEYPLGTKSHPGLFPRRNRIIAGLTLGTLIVEADIRSGSLITADAALEAGRDVFAVPGPITSPKSRGALDLIKQGAKLVTGAADIFEEYQSHLPCKAANQEGNALEFSREEDRLREKKLTSEESHLYHILHQGPFTLDELLLRTGWDFGHLHSVLLSLIIKKAVTQLPGAIYKVI